MKFKILKCSKRLNPDDEYSSYHKYLIKVETTWHSWFKKKTNYSYFLIETYSCTGVISGVYTKDGEQISIFSPLFDWIKSNFQSEVAAERKQQRKLLIQQAIDAMETAKYIA